MDTLVNTTYYPAILLRKRWMEAGAEERASFDVAEELRRIRSAAAPDSTAVSVLERWSAVEGGPDGASAGIRQAVPLRIHSRLPVSGWLSRRQLPKVERRRRVAATSVGRVFAPVLAAA